MTGAVTVLERPSPNHGERRTGPVDLLILHYTGMPTAEAALDRLCDPASEVSAHYLITETGAVWRLVDESRRAWHAGAAWWAGISDINSHSIGIELANPGHEGGLPAFPPQQMAALTVLAGEILKRHPIPPWRVLGHSDVAPDRKQDPGERFDWRALAEAGIGVWPETAPAIALGPGDPAALFRRIGYRDAARECVAAFQRHWRPTTVDGDLDQETLERAGLVAACVPG